MYLQFLFNMTGGALELSGTSFLIAVAVFACLLGAEIAGIAILISKTARGRREKQEMDRLEERSNDYYHYGFPILALGAIPKATYTALSIIAGLAAVAAVVFAVLLIVARKNGYLFISSKDLSALADAEKNPKPMEAPAVPFDQAEEQQRDACAENETAFAVFEEAYQEASEQEPETVEESMAVVEAPMVEESSCEAVVNTPAPVGDPVFADGSQPYKIVEKIVTETQKEIVREVPASPSKNDAAAEQLMEKLTDFLDYELQKRKEADLAENDDAVATLAHKELPEEEEDDEEDELDEVDSDEDEDLGFEESDDGEDRFTGNERIVGFDENTGCYLVAHYRKSFEAKLIQSRPHIKEYYSELKNALLSYKGTKSRISWTADSFHNGRAQIAKINVKTNILELYLALEPESLEGTVYRGTNVGSKKKYAETPFRYKLRTPRKFKWAMELVQRTCEEQGLSPIDIEKIDYVQQYPFESTESLVERKLIKEYIREEKPATTFELDPDHVPEVPEEDGSVIPANANFFWELDNDALASKEPEEAFEEAVEEPAEEIVEETEAPEEAPASAEPAPETNVVRETVKITEMRYTERYFANAEPTYERIVTTHEAIAAEDEPALTEEPVYEETEPLEEGSRDVPAEEEAYVEPFEEAEPAAELLYEESFEEAPLDGETFEEELPEEEEYFFDKEQPAEEIVYEEIYEEVPAEEEIYEEVYEEVPAEEEIYEEVYEEAPAEEELYEEVYEEAPAEEEIYEEVYEEAPAEEELYEEFYEAPSREIEYEEPVETTKVSRDAVPTGQIPLDTGVALIDICSVAKAFRDGDTVNLETLKEKGLVVPTARTLKIYAGGALDKRLSVEAHHFSLEAIFAIGTAGGETSMLY